MSGWIAVGNLDDIPRLGARVVRLWGVSYAVFRTDKDEVFALEDRCPHRGGPLSQGIVHGCRVTCPLHNLVIDLATGQAVAPDTGLTRRVVVKLEGARIFLDASSLAKEGAELRAEAV
jgi:nitrite reductase (NADH) small subunit